MRSMKTMTSTGRNGFHQKECTGEGEGVSHDVDIILT